MSDSVQITLIVSLTVLTALWMIRSAVNALLSAKKENFTFAIRFFGSGIWLFRGDHRPANSVLKGLEEESVTQNQLKNA